MASHYGLEIGDKVIYELARDTLRQSYPVEGEVTHLYATDNNRCQIQLKDNSIIDAICEWCKKVDLSFIDGVDKDKVIEKIIRSENPEKIAKIEEVLYDICDEQHSSCNDDCPVFYINERVRLISFSDISEKEEYSALDGLKTGEVYEVERIGSNGFIQLKDQKGYFHSPNKFEPVIIDDPPINIQWDGKCFEIDGIRVDPIVLKEILSNYEFDGNGNCIDIRIEEKDDSHMLDILQ
jgi:hypothetical protein